MRTETEIAGSEVGIRRVRYVMSNLHRMHWIVAWEVLAMFCKELTFRTRQGKLTVWTKDRAIGKALFVYREFELGWVRAALDFLRSSGRLPPVGRGTVLDIGANIGVISIGMVLKKEFQRAVAIEADPDNYRLLQRNALQNGLGGERYYCVHSAASDQAVSVEFELSPSNLGDHRVRLCVQGGMRGEEEKFGESGRQVIEVEADRLDNILERLPGQATRDIAMAWIDTQGHEGKVFAGGEQVFSKDIPVACEFWPYGIRRSGMESDEFCNIAKRLWRNYWRWRAGKSFVCEKIGELGKLFDELGRGVAHENVIFTK